MQVGERDGDGDAEKIGRLAIDGFAVAQDAYFGGGAADVHGDDVVEAVGFREIGAGVNSQDGTGFDGVNRFGLGDSGDAAVDMADEKSAGVSGGFAQLVFGFEEGGGERAVRVGVDERGIGAGAIFGGFGDVAAGEDRDGAEEMIGILLVNDAFDGNFAAGIAMGILQADADAAGGAFGEVARGVHDFELVGGRAEANHILLGNQAIENAAAGFGAVEVELMACGDQQTDARAAGFGEDVGSDGGGPANELDVLKKFPRVGETEFRCSLRKAVEEANG